MQEFHPGSQVNNIASTIAAKIGVRHVTRRGSASLVAPYHHQRLAAAQIWCARPWRCQTLGESECAFLVPTIIRITQVCVAPRGDRLIVQLSIREEGHPVSSSYMHAAKGSDVVLQLGEHEAAIAR